MLIVAHILYLKPEYLQGDGASGKGTKCGKSSSEKAVAMPLSNSVP